MKKIEKNIQKANNEIEKLLKENHFESNELKTLANSLDIKISALTNGLAEINELKNNLEIKKKEIDVQKTDIKDLIDELKKLTIKESKALLKRKKEETQKLKTKEKKAKEEQNKKKKK